MAFKTSGSSSPKLADVTSPEIQELFAQVYANPDDDSARLVLSDALIEVRNPRGDFIVMQFARSSGRAVQDQKERKLLRRFLDKWIAPFAECAHSPVFERGFLARCRLVPSKLTDALASAREWSTVRTIDFAVVDNRSNVSRFLLSEPIRLWTRRLENLDAANAGRALESPVIRRWRSLLINGDGALVAPAFAMCTNETMPELRSLELRGYIARQNVERIMQAQVTPQLDELSITDKDEDGPLTGFGFIAPFFGNPARPKRITLSGAAGSVKIDLRGELEGQIEIGLGRSAPLLGEAIKVLRGAPIKSIRILRATSGYLKRTSAPEREINQLRDIAEGIAPVKMELIP